MATRKPVAGKAATPVEATRHNDKRLNIPTEEQRDFVAEDERSPVPVEYERPLLYPRDPDADPQLVWRGKDEQDAEPLVVPALPLYIQEKIEPQAIIEDLRRKSHESADDFQASIFDDFDGLAGYEQVEFYEHAANWSNRLILGDALLVMNSLAEKERLRGQVQMIYVDPPYGIKFGSNWQVSTRRRDVRDGTDASRQPEQVKAFRDTWRDGVHSYLSYLRDRIVLARELLALSGSIFVQIGDENVHLVRNLLDESFGSENFVREIVVAKTAGLASTVIPAAVDYILWYAKDLPNLKGRSLFLAKADESGDDPVYRNRDEAGRLYRIDNLTSANNNVQSCLYEYEMDGHVYKPPSSAQWKTTRDGMDRLRLASRLQAGRGLYYRRYLDDFPVKPLNNLWADTGVGGFVEPKYYVVQTNRKIVQRCILMTTDPGDLVLDPTCGSGTTAYCAEQWARRWITIDTSRVALALARTRIMSARFPYYLLEDSAEGAAKEQELTGRAAPAREHSGDVRQGFVYRRVPHVMLSSIARNERIQQGLSREEIDRVIAQDADHEMLVDQPYDNPRKVRVSGRFTVESLSPHRTLDIESPVEAADETSFAVTVLENLQAAGVQNTFKGERLMFDSLEPYPGSGILQAHGTMTDAEGEEHTVAVAIGPEHGTVSPDMVKGAAREALKGAGFDLLVFCGFAFEAYTTETAKEFAPSGDNFVAAAEERQLGKLRVLLARMNPDLTMSEELLKKTGAGNLFTVFGEPDILIKESEGRYTVEVRGVDVYDPMTGQVRSASVDDIACWLIDTDYDGDQFFVRHAYFTGANEPYEQLQRALKADIDAEAWASLYSTVSRSFDPPTHGRIAVKVINHYGDEVMQVYDVGRSDKGGQRS